MSQIEDAALELGALTEAYANRYATAIAFVKEQVGEGTEYRNEVVRAMVSEKGAWCELVDLPAEFSGAAGDEIVTRTVTSAEALELLNRLDVFSQLVEVANTRRFDWIVLYGRDGLVSPASARMVHLDAGTPQEPAAIRQMGRFQPERVPRFFRVRIDSDLPCDLFGFKRGGAFFLAQEGERHLLVETPHDGEDVTDLAAAPASPMLQ